MSPQLHTLKARHASSALMLLISLLPGLISTQIQAQEPISNDFLKTAITFKLSKFTTWPETDKPTFNICSINDDDFTQVLKSLEKRTITGKPVKVYNGNDAQLEPTQCQILFINASETEQARRLLMSVSHSPVLTISDINNFTSFGGMIELSQQGQRYHFLINLKAVQNAGIQIASPLLELSTIVSD